MPRLRISAAESQVMAAVWDGEEAGRGGAGAEEILSHAGAANGWGDATVRTLIRRLIGKGALRSERRRGAVVYAPLIRRQDWVTGESQGLLDRLFGGQVAPLVAHYARHRALSAEEVARLKTLIAELETDDD